MPTSRRIVDLGEVEGRLYYVMEWVDGRSLEGILRLAEVGATKLPMGAILRIVADACEGMHAAHELVDEKGELVALVHRDISPQNLIVSHQGVTKVIDFGVLKARHRESEDTRGGARGKVRYMAPEQAQGFPVDPRADIFRWVPFSIERCSARHRSMVTRCSPTSWPELGSHRSKPSRPPWRPCCARLWRALPVIATPPRPSLPRRSMPQRTSSACSCAARSWRRRFSPTRCCSPSWARAW